MRQFVLLGEEANGITVAARRHVIIGHKHEFRIRTNGYDATGGELQGDRRHAAALVEHRNHAGSLNKAQFARPC